MGWGDGWYRSVLRHNTQSNALVKLCHVVTAFMPSFSDEEPIKPENCGKEVAWARVARNQREGVLRFVGAVKVRRNSG